MKTTRNITIDLDVWHQAKARGKELRTSASWVAEEALRHYLDIKPIKPERKTRAPKLATIADQPA